MSTTNAPEHETSLVNDPRRDPDAAKLVEQVRGDILDGNTTGFFNKLLRNHRTRSCWWPGKIKNGAINDGTKDGQTYGTRMANPYPGALDHEVRVVDGRCNEEVDLCMLAWHRSEKIVRPRDAMNDEQTRRAAAWRHALEFYLDASKEDLVDSLELFANTMSENGKAVWFEGWEKRWRMGRQSMEWGDVVAVMLQQKMAETGRAAEDAGQQPVVDENEWGQIHGAQFAAQMAMLRMDKEAIGELMEVIRGINPLISEKEAKKVARAFQLNENKVDYFCPMEETPMPVHEVYVPGVNCFYPAMSGTKQKRVPRMAFVEIMTEAQIRIASEQDGWDKTFTEEVLEKQRGVSIDFTGWAGGGATGSWNSYDLNGFDAGLQTDTQALSNAGLYFLVWSWTWGVNDNGLAAPFRALVHPNINDKVGLYECDPMGTGKMPWFLATRTKKRLLANASEGVPDEMLTNQLGRKKLEDAMTAQTELRANPPRLDLGDSSADGLRPGSVVGVAQKFLSNGGGPRFMDIPDISPSSFQMLGWFRDEEDRFYLRGENADPDAKRARMVRLVGTWCGLFESVLNLLCSNMQRGVDRLHLSSVSGREVDWEIRGEDLQGELDVVVRCDEGSIDPDLAQKKMEMFMSFAAQADRNGAAPWDEVFRKFAWWIDPALGGSVLPSNVAVDKIRADEAQRISQIVTGKNFTYDKMADAPNPRKDELDEWESDPMNQAMVAQNEVIAYKLERERTWILFAIEQMQVNPTTGKTGVPPDKRLAEMGVAA